MRRIYSTASAHLLSVDGVACLTVRGVVSAGVARHLIGDTAQLAETVPALLMRWDEAVVTASADDLAAVLADNLKRRGPARIPIALVASCENEALCRGYAARMVEEGLLRRVFMDAPRALDWLRRQCHLLAADQLHHAALRQTRPPLLRTACSA